MESKKIGGHIDLDFRKLDHSSKRRHKHPCSACTRFNSAFCSQCKCDRCQVFEGDCPKCKNLPKNLVQYRILHGVPQAGENWEKADTFTCVSCNSIWKASWDQLPKYDKCPRCNTVYFLYPYFTGQYKGSLRGATRSGFNWQSQDIFRCPSCNQYFYVEQGSLPGKHSCNCGQSYYCYQSVSKKRSFL